MCRSADTFVSPATLTASQHHFHIHMGSIQRVCCQMLKDGSNTLPHLFPNEGTLVKPSTGEPSVFGKYSVKVQSLKVRR